MDLLEMKNISKSFYTTQVLFDVDFSVKEGEVHALLGENGAGKSTLMNILGGVLSLDLGEIKFNGERVISPAIKTMEKLGIAFVHQELNVINDLRVYENIFLGKEKTAKLGKLRKKEMIEESAKLFEMLGLEMDPTAVVEELKTSEKQLLEICKALYFNAKLLILDEPTTALSTEEIKHLFAIINRLKEQGKSFIFISHKMPEIFEIADRYTVLRNGKVTASGKISETSPEEITKYMVGASADAGDTYVRRELGDQVLELKNLSGPGFDNLSFTVKKGEILALTGLAGCGASEVLECIFGASPIYSGMLTIEGKKEKKAGIKNRMKRGVAMLPSNRKENSVIPDMTILENFYCAEHILSNRMQHIFKKREQKKFSQMKDVLNIKAESSGYSINALSGGNQQKVFIARWLNTNADILLFDNPTQGVDVGAKEEIYKLILKFAEEGKTILVNTLEIPEIKRIADRCLVLYEGRLIGEFTHEEIDEHRLMQYATNAINV